MKYGRICAARIDLDDKFPLAASAIDTLKEIYLPRDMASLWSNVVAALEKANDRIDDLKEDARGVSDDYDTLETELLELQEKYDAIT